MTPSRACSVVSGGEPSALFGRLDLDLALRPLVDALCHLERRDVFGCCVGRVGEPVLLGVRGKARRGEQKRREQERMGE